MTGSRRVWVIALLLVFAAVLTGIAVFRRTAPAGAPRSPTAMTRTALFAEIQPVRITNCDMQRFGEPHDGGYALCANLLGDVKAGYSYGISGYDKWGCDVSRRLRIRVHQYDCFNLQEPSCPGGETMFHGECIGTARDTQDGRPFDTLANQFARNGDAAKPLVMKIDVEGAEWDAFLLAPDSALSQIDQLDVEFHDVSQSKYVEAILRLKQFFYVAHVHYNNFSCDASLAPFPSWAFEVLLVNKRIAKSDGLPARPASGVDAPNNASAADCQVASRDSAQVVRFIQGVHAS
ncbi:MAG TPA: hypothetical protein VFU28_11240 [Vicinamibacterales bacterium]|nr:hypothetical protein [Vicinamibacterales bacterium]